VQYQLASGLWVGIYGSLLALVQLGGFSLALASFWRPVFIDRNHARQSEIVVGIKDPADE